MAEVPLHAPPQRRWHVHRAFHRAADRGGHPQEGRPAVGLTQAAGIARAGAGPSARPRHQGTEHRAATVVGEIDWQQRNGQAFAEILEHLPTERLHGKVAATVVVTVEHQKLVSGLGAAGMDTGSAMSIGQVRRLACEAGILPAVLDGDSVPLDLGRTKRHFQESQRVALATAYHECAAADCDRPYAWCDLHHEKPWSRGGGPTWPTPSPCAGSTIASCMARGTRRASTGWETARSSPSGDGLRCTRPGLMVGRAPVGEGALGRGRIAWWTRGRALLEELARAPIRQGLAAGLAGRAVLQEESAKDTSARCHRTPGRTLRSDHGRACPRAWRP